MKNALLALALFSSSAFALTETNVATCELRAGNQLVGSMNIFSSDNGDEGFLRFAYVITDDEPGCSVGQFTDNVQDAGAAFLTTGVQKLYVPIEGASTDENGYTAPVAVYLKNNGKSIKGMLKTGFNEFDLVCTKN